jgi:hypothetical protein
VTRLELLGWCVATYIVNTLAFVSAYWLIEWCGHWHNDRQWRRERAAAERAFEKARGAPRR